MMRRSYAVAATAAMTVVLACGGPPERVARPQVAASTTNLIGQAEAQEKLRRYDRARHLYERAVADAPDDPSRAHAAVAFGRALIFWGEYQDAEAQLSRAVDLAPDMAGAWHDLGMVRHQLGDLDGAEAALGAAVSSSPRDPRSRIALAALMWKRGRDRDALAQYEALAKLDLPERVRDKVLWAIDTLRARLSQ